MAAAMAVVPATGAEKPLPDLITIGAPARQADLVSIEPTGDLRFGDSAGETFSVRVSDLVRWSTPNVTRPPDELMLVDGSRLRIAAGWGKEPTFGVGQAGILAKSEQLGQLDLPRSQVRAVFWRLPTDDAVRQKRIDELLAAQTEAAGSDILLLDNGDRMTGTLTSIGQTGNPLGDGEGPVVVSVVGPLGAIETPLERVRGIAFSPGTAVPPAANADAETALYVGLRDGSLIAADSMVDGGGEVLLRSASLSERRIAIKDIASLQADGERVAYLVDLESSGFRHEPYLDLKWPFARDRNVLGGVPTANGRSFLKTIGMHSASRLTFDLDGEQDRFAATVAVDDAAEGGGSVVFRVFLSTGGTWREAYASGVVRGGDPPKDVAVDLAESDQLALVVDYADRGDERDYANWLDARFERTTDDGATAAD